jgi:hypothetical protein
MLIFTVILFFTRWSSNLADLYIVLGASNSWLMVTAKVIGYVFLVLAIFICLWMISLGVNYKQGPWALFRNAVIMTVGTLPQTIIFAAAALIPFVLAAIGSSWLLAIAIILIVLIGFSYAMLVWMDFSQWAFDRFINPKMGVAVGKGIYSKDKSAARPATASTAQADSAAIREYKRMIVAQGKSRLVSRPIKPIDDDMEMYQLPESFSRDDLRKLKESKTAIEEDVRQYEEEHKDEERYVEYNRQFEEREKALREPEGKKKKKAPKPPKMLNKR